MGAPMAGQLIAYPASGVESPLLALAMVLEDDAAETKACFCVCDLLMLSNELAASARKLAASVVGCPESSVVISVTHTHSGPSLRQLFGQEANAGYEETMMEGIKEACARAAAQCVPRRLYWGSGVCEGVGFNRRFVMADGSVETHPLSADPLIVRAEGKDSSVLHVLAACGLESDEAVGVSVFFGCHATVMPRNNTEISADFPGRVRNFVTCELCGVRPGAGERQDGRQAGTGVKDVTVMYFQTSCGNICQCNPLSRDRSRPPEVGTAQAKAMGKTIGTEALKLASAAMADGVATTGALVTGQSSFDAPRRPIPADLLDWAQGCHAADSDGGDQEDGTEGKGRDVESAMPAMAAAAAAANTISPALFEPPPQSNYGTEFFDDSKGAVSLEALFKSPWWARFYAREIVELQAAAERDGPTVPFYISVVGQRGSWAVVSLPCELFVEIAEEIEAKSPFPHTAINTLANGYNGYVLTPEAFERPGGYETKFLSSSFLAKETGSMVVAETLRLLNELAAEDALRNPCADSGFLINS